ncbi:MAG: GAF domain-containing protein [Mycobacterium sp.]
MTDEPGGGDQPDPDRSTDAAPPDSPSGGSLFTTLGVLCAAAVKMTGTDGAAVAALMSTKSRELVYATDTVAERIDELQYTLGEGPCLDAYTSQWPQLYPRIGGAERHDRWMAFAGAVVELGVHAVFTFPVPGPQHALGVLELYRRTPGAMDDGQLNHASLCADAISRTIMSIVPQTLSPSDAVTYAEAILERPGNPFNRSEVSVAAEMVALQLNVSADEALARIRAHAYARDVPMTSAAADVMTGRLILHA